MGAAGTERVIWRTTARRPRNTPLRTLLRPGSGPHPHDHPCPARRRPSPAAGDVPHPTPSAPTWKWSTRPPTAGKRADEHAEGLALHHVVDARARRDPRGLSGRPIRWSGARRPPARAALDELGRRARLRRLVHDLHGAAHHRARGNRGAECAHILAALRGDRLIALGYSEPDSGSDVAAAKTTAVRDGDEWVINGQKMFTSTAQLCSHVFVLARTDQGFRAAGGRHHLRRHQRDPPGDDRGAPPRVAQEPLTGRGPAGRWESSYGRHP